MKQLRTLALMAICAFTLSAFAQQTPPPDAHEGHGQGQGQGQGTGQGMTHKMPTADEMVQMMSEKLSLTEDQKPKVAKIADDMHKKMESMMSDQAMSREDRMAKMRAAHDESMAKVRAILNDDQKKKLDEWQKDMHDHDHKMDHKTPQADDRVQK